MGSNPVEAPKNFFFRAISQLLKSIAIQLRFNCDGRIIIHFICIPTVHIISFCVLIFNKPRQATMQPSQNQQAVDSVSRLLY